ncbi:hypothetical protein FD755_011385 [Muntiacus reevesi]|uniref:Cornichon family AMPA receptor auxiliary protein 4 n=1 Tax=Muntiacus reevesi TaxID=9886 RepID=A0A5N3XTC2_MUNRE|nr:hypothetical protein FD755_011385 [Muntiacus reevesi]
MYIVYVELLISKSFLFSWFILDCLSGILIIVVFETSFCHECEYKPSQIRWVIPELVGHTLVTVLMLISLHWFIFLLNLPVASWNIYRYIMVPSGNMGVFDPTEIHNRGQLKSHMKEAMIKLGFHLLCFFMYLYRPKNRKKLSCVCMI